MIVKILKKSATFKGVSYNTGKVEKNRGELLLVKNFGMLQGLENLRPQDYINYLEAVSTLSTRTKYPQFHIAISAKGRSHSKEELADIAQKWMQGMGYGEQPYLLIFHKDTANNHVHLVSTRVGKDGKKISDSYEKLRAYRVLNQVMGEDEKQTVSTHLEKALSYSISTRAQFMMILEAQGYALSLKKDEYAISKYGRELARLEVAKVDQRIAGRQKDSDRIKQIRAILEKYRTAYDPSPVPLTPELPGGTVSQTMEYRSALSEFLHEKFGLQTLFHAKDGKPPYGYTLIDHAAKAVYKGGEIMALTEFIAKVPDNGTIRQQTGQGEQSQPYTYADNKTDGEAIAGDFHDTSGFRPAPLPETDPDPGVQLPILDINISDDVDDEAIHGRNRRRKHKARTNTR